MAGIEYDRPERDAGAGAPRACPHCRQADQLRAVQAVFLEGHRHVRTESGTGDQRHAVTREVVSRLARALAPAPPNRAYRARTEPGLAAAERLWARGWYCGRCARAHFEGESAALTLQEFRVRVWTAGGYGDLAEAHPAVDLHVALRPDASY
ncbi:MULTISPECIES: hypothetical protein [unclassified Streptomyces]|uniref:hypothetical protein n=1 Tax=unclassified Streptomyces TaxID=2593676 RepID=UPI00202F375A|nr:MULTISPECIES: hypothetical protein [unclassified Streptomyces]MCM1965795.1 hypothetical protein [Streptomyces sp. G1]MCX5126482.1 hypothetical protein [Streptomyces sp. NBC_00347]